MVVGFGREDGVEEGREVGLEGFVEGEGALIDEAEGGVGGEGFGEGAGAEAGGVGDWG